LPVQLEIVLKSGRLRDWSSDWTCFRSMKLLRLAQYGDGARALARFNVQSCSARKTPSPLADRTLKRRKHRAPLALPPCHCIVRASIVVASLCINNEDIYPRRLRGGIRKTNWCKKQRGLPKRRWPLSSAFLHSFSRLASATQTAMIRPRPD